MAERHMGAEETIRKIEELAADLQELMESRITIIEGRSASGIGMDHVAKASADAIRAINTVRFELSLEQRQYRDQV